ncbi:MAG: LamG-like jellyroll fold domain-containing protein [Kiritimatiellia bacterium]
MKPAVVALPCLSLLMGATLDARSETVSLTPVADAVIYSPKAGDSFEYANGAGQFLHAGVNGPTGGNRVLRSLLRFDLSAHIPPGATVTQVVLRVTKDSQGSTGILRLHRMTSAWSEGATDPPNGEGLGVAAGSGDVTWTGTLGSSVWGVAGGDFAATPSAQASVTAPGPVTFSSPQLLADVRAMAASASANHGWIIRNADEATGGNSLQFDSRTNGSAAGRPVLEIGYTTQPYPLLYYDFSEGGGTVVTNLGSLAVNGTLLGAAGDERWVSGPHGGALEFDGQDLPAGDRISTGLTAATLGFNSSNYTAAAWILFTKPMGDNMVFGQVSATSNVLHLGVRDSRAHLGHWGNDVTGVTPIFTNIWYHIAWEYRQGHQRIFLNGNLDAGPAARGLLAAASEVVIGQSGPATWGFQGRLDDVVVYNQPLHLMQIRHLAAGGDPRALPADELTGNPTFYTAPFGPGGTWNLYQYRGTLADRPRTWVDAENQAAATPDPSGISGLPGHLADVTGRQENFFLERITGFVQFWIGLTDHENYGGTEAGTNRNGAWKWTSGVPYSYQNWNTSEPNNTGVSGEDGVQILANTGLWNDSLNGIAPQDVGAPLNPCVVEWQIASPTPVPGAQVMPPILPTPLAGRGPANAAFGVRAVSNAGTLDNIVRAVTALQSGLGTILEGAPSPSMPPIPRPVVRSASFPATSPSSATPRRTTTTSCMCTRGESSPPTAPPGPSSCAATTAGPSASPARSGPPPTRGSSIYAARTRSIANAAPGKSAASSPCPPECMTLRCSPMNGAAAAATNSTPRQARTIWTPTPPPGVWWAIAPGAPCPCRASGCKTAPTGWCAPPPPAATRPSPI